MQGNLRWGIVYIKVNAAVKKKKNKIRKAVLFVS